MVQLCGWFSFGGGAFLSWSCVDHAKYRPSDDQTGRPDGPTSAASPCSSRIHSDDPSEYTSRVGRGSACRRSIVVVVNHDGALLDSSSVISE